MAENSNPSGRYRSAKELKQIVKEDKGQPMPDLGSPEEWGEFERALGGRKIIQPVAPKPEEVEKNKLELESEIDNIVDKINEKFDDTEKQLDKALGDGIITEAQRDIFVKSLENHASLFDRYDKGERSDELLQLLIDYLQKINERVENLLIRKSVPLPPEKLPIEKKKEKVVAAKIIGKEESFPGELVADLKNKYLELFRLRKEKENLPEQLPNEIAEIKKQIREFYRQKGLKGLNYRLQIGEIIEKIKTDAEREARHKKMNGKIKKETAKIVMDKEEFKLYIDAGKEFYEKLKNEFHWENYSEERKKQSLEIETEVFLTSLLPESIKKQKTGKEEILKSLMTKIIK